MIVLVCRSCAALLTGPLAPLDAETWQATESWRLHVTGDSLVAPTAALRWTNELWRDETMQLPFVTNAWVIDPDSLVITASVTTPHGCCGYMPRGNEPNQLCTCERAIGWINTDCLMPEFLALDPDAVEALAP